ncbi:class I SAM-dependent RNA methyltransferase [Pseudenhygromyxa sp. WMMC2535]|uniref:THUMP domain-containing class I SAM-dependent RNA methyltransferase n=1 Tax=Pseudenhygromyxa sp. WMMC2535 TaxID=2712867 RepID=UPI001554EC8D|nr:class I SAM-dependent RNA methyltransferase [Pseudenhygromyxa sp. WMMC2535]NVB37657.1 class I SAM-dependent RNA methyltransferase [Pseudenhygromyxa sp. WMMC2535]
MSERLALFVACAPGLEPLLLDEINALGVEETATVPGGVRCFGTLDDVYRLNVGCGLALRVLVRVAEFFVRDFRKLERVTAALEWERWLDADRGVRVRSHSKRSRLYHSKAIAERVERSIAKRTRGAVAAHPDVGARGFGGGELGEGSREPTLIQVRIVRDRCTISLDTTGTLLHKRGWRAQTGKAPLREDLARALLLLAGWRPGMALLDPMAGAGTLAIEAASIVAGRPPGDARKFAVADMRMHDQARLDQVRAALREQAAAKVEGVGPASIVGRDRDAGVVEAAQANAARAGVGERVRFVQAPLGDFDLGELAGDGLALVSNPPWGQRTGDPKRLRNLYATFGKLARERSARVGLVTADASLAHATGLKLERALLSEQGGVKVGLWVGEAG